MHLVDKPIYRIGKSPTNDLVLGEGTVSRTHCEIVQSGRGFLVRDLGSTNGTFLNGTEIREAWLKSGSFLTIGRVDLRVVIEEQAIELKPSPRDSLGPLFGQSLKMRELFTWIEELAPTDFHLLIWGERGTGKSLVARTIHEQSQRSDGPFVAIDLRQAPGSWEVRLFGESREGQEGERPLRLGAFEEGGHGTLVLEGVEDTPLDLQKKIARVLELRTFRRVGSERDFRFGGRVIVCLEKDPSFELKCGHLHDSLYRQFAPFTFRLPSLGERLDDLPGLVERWFGQRLPSQALRTA
ncbi:MAG: sigma 54-interacting transcriptional regulator, partial [Deltaproteobacteria bacterium]|nr:sigma 54-interacting transcriptional regulator [Deltaproteobacteria bacterium]